MVSLIIFRGMISLLGMMTLKLSVVSMGLSESVCNGKGWPCRSVNRATLSARGVGQTVPAAIQDKTAGLVSSRRLLKRVKMVMLIC